MTKNTFVTSLLPRVFLDNHLLPPLQAIVSRELGQVGRGSTAAPQDPHSDGQSLNVVGVQGPLVRVVVVVRELAEFESAFSAFLGFCGVLDSVDSKSIFDCSVQFILIGHMIGIQAADSPDCISDGFTYKETNYDEMCNKDAEKIV